MILKSDRGCVAPLCDPPPRVHCEAVTHLHRFHEVCPARGAAARADRLGEVQATAVPWVNQPRARAQLLADSMV
eukprot:4760150-Prymnesium_polylepis.1